MPRNSSWEYRRAPPRQAQIPPGAALAAITSAPELWPLEQWMSPEHDKPLDLEVSWKSTPKSSILMVRFISKPSMLGPLFVETSIYVHLEDVAQVQGALRPYTHKWPRTSLWLWIPYCFDQRRIQKENNNRRYPNYQMTIGSDNMPAKSDRLVVQNLWIWDLFGKPTLGPSDFSCS